MHTPHRSAPTHHVAIVGGGFSGTLQAVNILRHAGPRVTLIERRPVVGRGTAYSAAHEDHLLNVRAGNMSAFPDDPRHFVRWLERRELGGAADFISRRTYGTYLGDILDDALATCGGRLTVVRDEVTDVTFAADGATVTLAEGAPLRADKVVLSVGNLPPHEPPPLRAAGLGPDVYAADPWSDRVVEGLDDADEVLVLGTGLTMIDVALLLDSHGFRGRTLALSRRGLLPRSHVAPAGPASSLAERPAVSGSDLVHCVRARADQVGWRAAVDELRPYTQGMWLNASEAERARFLRHLRPWWDVHRHRIAPRVAERIETMRADGRLRDVAGKILRVEAVDGGAEVVWRPRGQEQAETLRVRRIVNCTGPQGDLLRTDEPLLRSLLERGLIRPDAQHLGIEVNQQAEAVAADGTAQKRLLAIGPMTRGAFWEIVAVPDIRVQSWALARRLSNAHWVEGEGL
ncbi:FAD/NAD(P)-binding protein [Sphingomonas sp. LY54]|uniref:FAD/NAD(P)-binding protein n=1 Tax=Sphingomonas sp. LY54 TaxID=3095343 RepID=UPI002D779F68|nr:FAD/NAD(P)-binding protein [Sphingomonas sp. LY54]WRP30134.1 FAD/NAD(P)-binding protein [Sphingomonas sp. LY54]